MMTPEAIKLGARVQGTPFPMGYTTLAGKMGTITSVSRSEFIITWDEAPRLNSQGLWTNWELRDLFGLQLPEDPQEEVRRLDQQRRETYALQYL